MLALFSGDRLLPSNVQFDESLRLALDSIRVENVSEFLDEARFPNGHDTRMRELARAKLEGRPVDVVVAFGPPSVHFCVENQSELFPGVPIVFAGVESVGARPDPSARITGVLSGFDAAATLRLALKLHPRTRQVYVVTDPLAAGAPEPLGAAGVRVPLHGLAASSPQQLGHALASIPENSLVIDLSSIGRGAGSTTSPRAELKRLSEASRSPIYGAFDPLVDYGYVGTVSVPLDEVGRAAAAMVRQVVSLEPGAPLPAVKVLEASPLLDWRQLKRWGVRSSRVPAGSVLRYKPPSFWRQHLLLVITTGALILLQSGLIIALVLQDRRRRRAEHEGRQRREELAHMTRIATMGELTASLAHEINQPLAAILSNAQAALRLLARDGASSEEIREILSDIAADDQRAGEVIRRMRSLLRKGEASPVAVDVNELVDDVASLVRGEMILQNISLALELAPDLPYVYGDRVQLQQVLLNLIVNALDAMRDAPGESRSVVIRTSAPASRSVEISVKDAGAGVPADRIGQIFEPFVTTKSQGLGLGLSICRSIIQAHGGRIGCTNNADRGCTFRFTLPAHEGAKA